MKLLGKILVYAAVLLVYPGVPLFFTVLGGKRVYKLWTVRNRFVETEGTITSSKVDIEFREDEDGTTTSFYSPEIRFRHEVDGRTHETGSFAHKWSRPQMSDRAEVEILVDHYLPGETKLVWYNPEDPAEAYLYLGNEKDGSAFFVAGLVFLLIPILLYLLFLSFWLLKRRR